MKTTVPVISLGIIFCLLLGINANGQVKPKVNPYKLFTYKQPVNKLTNYYKEKKNKIKLFNTSRVSTIKYGTATRNGLVMNIVKDYDSPILREVTARGNNSSPCAPFNVNVKSKFALIRIDGQTNSPFVNQIYPGALVTASRLLNSDYSTNLTQRPPTRVYSLTTSLYPVENAETVSGSATNIAQLTTAAISDSLKHIYARCIRGRQTLPATFQILDVSIVESEEQWKAENSQLLSASMSSSLSLPVDAIMISSTQAANVSLSTSASNQLIKKKSVAVLTYRHVVFTASIEANDGPLDSRSFFNLSGSELSQVPDDLLYIQNVEYGRTIQIVIESESSREELALALNFSLGLSSEASIKELESGAGLGTERSIEIESKTAVDRVFVNNKIKIKYIIYGGETIDYDDLNLTAQALKNAGGKDDVIKNALNNLGIQYPRQFIPVPIGITCRFAKDNAFAVISADGNYISQTCPASYDIDIVLHSLIYFGAVAPYFSDKIFGKTGLVKWELKGARDNAPYFSNNNFGSIWNVSESNAVMMAGEKIISNNNIASIKGLTYQQLKELVFYLRADFKSALSDNKYSTCSNCEESDKSRLYSMSSQMDEVDARNATGNWSVPEILDIGSDKYTELECTNSAGRKLTAKIQLKVYAGYK